MQAVTTLPGTTVSILTGHDQSETLHRDPPRSSRRVLVIEHLRVCENLLPSQVACMLSRPNLWTLQ
jgi:hypothetical protein